MTYPAIRIKLFIAFLFFHISAFAQSRIVETRDINNYWMAFDSIRNTNDYSKQLEFINRIYIKGGTPGVAAFIKARGYTDTLWVNNINAYPKFWASIRSNTLQAFESARELEKQVKKLKNIYPDLKPSKIYFEIGGLNTGGTTSSDNVLIGTEIVSGDQNTDVSEFKGTWLKNIFSNGKSSGIVYLNLHEYIHTQQRGITQNVLGQAIREGSCDFIAELVMEKPIATGYLTFGRAHADSLKQEFKKDMFSGRYSSWFYNGGDEGDKADLGYYIGYEIAKGYYKNAKNKKQAVKELISVDQSSAAAVESLLLKSGYFAEGFDKQKLIADYTANQPYITAISPFDNHAANVDAGLKEVRITFSKPMVKSVSINISSLGRDHFPLKKVVGYENDNRTLVLAMELLPGKEYGFDLMSRGFRSQDGYVLKDEVYHIVFSTK
jgi:hypothetical protein